MLMQLYLLSASSARCLGFSSKQNRHCSCPRGAEGLMGGAFKVMSIPKEVSGALGGKRNLGCWLRA